jgi:hypothetical protein
VCIEALEIETKCDLSCPVAGVLRGLGGAQDAESGGVVDLRRRRREICVIQNVGEGGLEAQLRALSDREVFRQAE